MSAGVVRRRCRLYRHRLVQPAAWRGPAATGATGRRAWADDVAGAPARPAELKTPPLLDFPLPNGDPQ